MRYLHVILLSFFFIHSNLSAQSILSGIVTGGEGKTLLPSVLIGVFEKDSVTLIDQVYSDQNGYFMLNLTSNGPILIRARLFGYEEYKSHLIELSQEDTTIISPMNMRKNEILLNEVTVLERQGFVTLHGDRITYDVEQSGIGIGNNSIEVLDKVPGLKLDKDDNVLFRGNRVQVLVNGKKPLMEGEILTQYLKSLRGEEIKSIEVISNPSAKYDASGAGGLINIVLKKGARKGFSGLVYGSAAYAEFGKIGTGFNLYNQSAKWRFNAGGYYGYFESVNHRKIIQKSEVDTIVTELEQTNDWFPKSKVMNGKFGLEYSANKNNTFGTSWNFDQYFSDETTLGRTNEIIQQETINYTILQQENVIKRNVITASTFYDFMSDSSDASLSAQFNFAMYTEAEDQKTKSEFFNSKTGNIYKSPDDLIYRNPKEYKLGSLKLDGYKKINKKLSFEYGAKWSYVGNQYVIQIERSGGDGVYLIDDQLSNELFYRESISAAYSSLDWNSKDWNAQLGLRGERIDYLVSANKNSMDLSGRSFSLFPTFTLNKSLKKNQFKLSYSRRISRPRYLDRNPFFRYIDTYNINVGNPGLKPEFSNVLDFTWIVKGNTSISLFANHTVDAMFDVISYNDETLITTVYNANIAKKSELGLSASTSFDITDWWTTQLYGEVIYNRAKSELVDFEFDLDGLNGYVDLNQSFYLKKDWSINWSAFYVASGSYGNSFSPASYDMSFAVKKQFFNQRLNLKFRAQNVLKRNLYRAITTQGNVTTDWTNRWETRKFTVAVSYTFGKGKRKKIKETNLDDEEQRL